jgi:hypothetical protein
VAIALAAGGIVSIAFCFRTILMKFLHVYPTGIYKRPENFEEVGDVLYRRKLLSAGPRIVVIGGGTGISTMLRGLKRFSSNITAVITVADDGGGSGTLREDLGMLPPGISATASWPWPKPNRSWNGCCSTGSRKDGSRGRASAISFWHHEWHLREF